MIHKGLAGVVVDTTAISKVVPETNSLTYRGYPVQDLATHCCFEQVAYLLWHGELPTDAELALFCQRERASRRLDRSMLSLLAKLPDNCHPMDVVRTTISYLGAEDPDEDERLDRVEDELADASAHRESGAAAVDLLGSDGGALDRMAEAIHLLDRRGPFDTAVGRLRDLTAELGDVVADLRQAAESVEEDPERLDEVRTRRQLLVDLRRRYGDTLAEVMAYEAQVAGEIAAMPPLAAIAVKEMVNATFETGLAQGINFERRLFHGLFGTADQKEGMAAFVEKRPGQWTGR